MADLVVVYDRDGTPLADMPVSIIRNYRSESTVQIAKGQFTIAANHPKATAENLLTNNIVVVQSSLGIPNWAGIIYGDHKVSGGQVTVQLRAAEYLLGLRYIAGQAYGPQIAGSLFKQLIYNAGNVHALPLSDDETQITIVNADVVQGEFRDGNVYDAVNQLANQSGYYWGLKPIIPPVGGALVFTPWFLPRVGKTFVQPLVQDKNFADLEISEIGNELCNSLRVYARMEGWTEPVFAWVQDLQSQARYGLIENVVVNLTIKTVASAQTYAESEIKRRAWPYLRIAGTITAPPYPVAGDKVNVILGSSAGIYARNGSVNCRVKTARYDPDENTISVVVEEERE